MSQSRPHSRHGCVTSRQGQDEALRWWRRAGMLSASVCIPGRYERPPRSRISANHVSSRSRNSLAARRGSIRAWRILREPCLNQHKMHARQPSWLRPQVHNDVDVVGWTHVGGSALDLVQEDHLSADQQPVLAERLCKLDQGLPRLCLPPDEWRQNDCRVIHRTQPDSLQQPSGERRRTPSGPGRPLSEGPRADR